MAKRAQLDEIRPILDKTNEHINKAEAILTSIEEGADKATDVLEHGIEKVADVVPEALDTAVHVVAEGTRKGVRIFSSPRNMLIAVSLTGAVAGAGLGVLAYFLQKKAIEKKLRAEFEAELDKQIEGMRLFYERRSTRKQPFSSPEEAAEKLLPPNRVEEKLVDDAVAALTEYEGDQPPVGVISDEDDPRSSQNHRTRYDKVPQRNSAPQVEKVEVEKAPVEEVVKNVFVEHADLDGWNQEAEVSIRNPTRPYIISHDEFMESENDDQRSITYYSGDDVLADEQEVPIDDVEATIGMQNLRFGHGSRDSNVVHIRNERIEVDFEVTLNTGRYGDEVLGLQHSDTPRIRHGRRGDDG